MRASHWRSCDLSIANQTISSAKSVQTPRGTPGILSRIAAIEGDLSKVDSRIRALFGRRRYLRGVRRGLRDALSEILPRPQEDRKHKQDKPRLRNGKNKTPLFSILLSSPQYRRSSVYLLVALDIDDPDIFDALVSRHVANGYLTYTDPDGVALTTLGVEHARQLIGSKA